MYDMLGYSPLIFPSFRAEVRVCSWLKKSQRLWRCVKSFLYQCAANMDVGQNGRPLMGAQMEMSSLVLTIQ